MTEARKVFRNTAVLVAGNVGDRILGIAAGVILARALGPAALGTYSFAFAYLGFFTVFVDLGIRTIIDREICRDPSKADRLVGNGMAMRLAASTVVVAAANAGLLLTGYPAETRALVAVASASLLLVFSSLYLTVFEASLRMERPTAVTLATSAVKTLLFLAVAAGNRSPMSFAVAAVAASVLNVAGLAVVSRGFLAPRLEFDREVWAMLLRESWPLILTSFVSMVYYRIDQLMLYPMAGERAMGYYSTAVRLTEGVRILPTAFAFSIFPLMSRSFGDSTDRLEQSYAHSVRYLALAAFAVILAFTFAGEPATCLLFGAEYRPAAAPVRVLVWAEAFLFFHMLNHTILVAMNRQRFLFALGAVSAAVNVLLNLLMIPRWGAMGAAWATAWSYFALTAVLSAFPETRRIFAICAANAWRPASAGLCGLAAGWALARAWGWPAGLAGAAAVFAASARLLGALTPSDAELLRGVVRRRPV